MVAAHADSKAGVKIVEQQDIKDGAQTLFLRVIRNEDGTVKTFQEVNGWNMLFDVEL